MRLHEENFGERVNVVGCTDDVGMVEMKVGTYQSVIGADKGERVIGVFHNYVGYEKGKYIL